MKSKGSDEMILYKTDFQEMPNNCAECKLNCRLPCKKNCFEPIIRKQYLAKRHPGCPLIEIKEGDDEG